MLAAMSTSQSHSSETLNNSANAQATKTTLTEDARHRLENLASQIDKQVASAGNSKFLKILANESKVLLFDENRIEQISVTYPGSTDGPSERIRCFVREVSGNGAIIDQEPRDWTVSITTGRDILKWVLKGFKTLDVSRTGSGMRDTKYSISPHI